MASKTESTPSREASSPEDARVIQRKKELVEEVLSLFSFAEIEGILKTKKKETAKKIKDEMKIALDKVHEFESALKKLRGRKKGKKSSKTGKDGKEQKSKGK